MEKRDGRNYCPGDEGVRYSMDAIGFMQFVAASLIAQCALLRAQWKMRDKSMPSMLLMALLWAVIALTVLDLFCGMSSLGVLEAWEIPLPYGANVCSNVLYDMLTGWCCFLVFLYAESEMGSVWLGDRKKLLQSTLPLLLFWILLLLPRGGQRFWYLDENGMPRASWALLPLYLVVLLYLAALLLHGIGLLANGSEKTARETVQALLLFTLGPAAGILLQIGWPGRGLLCTCLTLGLIHVYVVIQQNKITVDTLTGISNRPVLLRYLENELPYYRRHPNKSLYFLMMDLDHFKHINDVYGHLEGDAALVLLARTLKKVCANYNCVLARYGGDEFCIACGCDIVGVRTLIASIKRELIAANEASGKPYQIEISIGCAKLKPEIATVHDLIDKADQEMYLIKTRKRSTENAAERR